MPLSLGDSHRGFRVLGTTPDYFTHYKYRQTHGLTFSAGSPFADLFDAVIGADVAAALGYKVGDPHRRLARARLRSPSSSTTTSRSASPASWRRPARRSTAPCTSAWRRSRPSTSTGRAGRACPASPSRPTRCARWTCKPKAITAALIGLKSKLATFRLQRAINEYREEPLSAILPGAALQELWGLVGTAETALKVVSAMVVATALLGMVTMILTTLNERRREMAILRSVGARPRTILGLLMAEAGVLTAAGIVLGVVLLYAALLILQPYVDATYGLHLPVDPPKPAELATLGIIVVAGCIAGLLPALRAYRLSLADGMTVRT